MAPTITGAPVKRKRPGTKGPSPGGRKGDHRGTKRGRSAAPKVAAPVRASTPSKREPLPKDGEEEELEHLVFRGAGASLSAWQDLLQSAEPRRRASASEEDAPPAPLDDDEAGPDEDDNEEEEEEEEAEVDVPLFTIDTTGTNGSHPARAGDSEADSSEEGESSGESPRTGGHGSQPTTTITTPAAAWTDVHEVSVDLYASRRLRKLRNTLQEGVVVDYEERLRKQFQKIHPQPAWAKLPAAAPTKGAGTEAEADAEALASLKTAQGIISSKTKAVLTADFLPVLRLKNANQAAPSQAVVQVVEFHPSAPVLLTCGYDKTLRLFQIDGKVNPKLHSIHLKDLPLHSAHFTADGHKVILTGKRKHFYVYDMETRMLDRVERIAGRTEERWQVSLPSPCNRYIAFLGKDGYIVLVSLATRQWVGNLKMNGAVTCMAFAADGSALYTFGEEGEVYCWDMETRTCAYRFVDEGCVKASALAVSPDGKFLATGSSTGVINLYRIADAQASRTPTPVKSFFHLTTTISTLRFHPDSQILAAGSGVKQDAFKLIHVPSLSVFQNWPTSNTPLGRVCAANFSADGSHLVIANDKGRVLLYRLLSYAS